MGLLRVFLVVNVLLMAHLLIFSLFEVCMCEILKQCFCLTLPVVPQVVFSQYTLVMTGKWICASHLVNSNNFVIKFYLSTWAKASWFFWSLFSYVVFLNSLLIQTKLVQCRYYLHIIGIVKNNVLWFCNIFNTSFSPRFRCMLGRSWLYITDINTHYLIINID